uniref:T cell receptor gamma variable 9 n=1 Tax=Lepisosteus oculatus TaxID=7918 RepID=W5N059_LEPOC
MADYEVVSTTLLCTLSETAITLKQDQVTLTKGTTKTARISCKVNAENFGREYIHWYQQKEGEALKRILYIAGAGNPTIEEEYKKAGFSADKITAKEESNLFIASVSDSHSATYYCACWDTHSD